MSNTKYNGRRRVTAGIDWASEDHVVAIVDDEGRAVDRFNVAHTAPELRRLVARLRRDGVVEVAIERPDGPVVEALLDGRFDGVRDRARARSRTCVDATDRPATKTTASTPTCWPMCCAPTAPGCVRCSVTAQATVTLRMTVRARQDLVARPGGDGQPTACTPADHAAWRGQTVPRHRQRHHPGVPDPLPRQDKADWLSRQRLDNWLASVGYNHRANLHRFWTHLRDAPRGTTGPSAHAQGQITLALLAALARLNTQIEALDHQIADQLATHPDAAIFTSLPRSGTVRAARLLAEIGDARGRFPTPEALACLAGAAPSTRQSGKVKVVTFRWAVDKQLRGAVIDFAGDSWQANPWAADLYWQARDRRPGPPPRRPHPRPRLAPHHLALLARRRALRPRQTRRPTTPRRSSGLTQGYSMPR